MKRLSLISLFLLSFNSVFSQEIDLCGIWFGYNYNCYEFDSVTGVTFPYSLTEIIDIRLIGDTTYATKITGDDCVTAGQITWKGVISGSESSVFVTLGSPEAPNSVIDETTLIVVNPTFLDLAFTGVTYRKANCNQIDSMKNEGLPINSNCVTCETLIPNVFTPNNDLSNDYFSFLIKEQEGFLGFQIFNRWGEIVYYSNDLSVSWDGKSGGKECTDGIYFWNFLYDSKHADKNKSGFLTLIR